MDIDLLFVVVNHHEWKSQTTEGIFEPPSYKENGTIQCLTGDSVENHLNEHFLDSDKVLLIVIDPLRIEAPMKRSKQNNNVITIHGTFSMDAVIDKIPVIKDKNGKYSVRIKHFD